MLVGSTYYGTQLRHLLEQSATSHGWPRSVAQAGSGPAARPFHVCRGYVIISTRAYVSRRLGRMAENERTLPQVSVTLFIEAKLGLRIRVTLRDAKLTS